MNAIQGYLEKLGGNFMIAAFIPSLAFVTACMVSFQPLFPATVFERIQASLNPLGQSGLIILLIAIMMGFILTSLNTYVYKLFEGYVLFDFLKPLRKLEIKRARSIRSQRDILHKKVERLQDWKEKWEQAGMPEYHTERMRRVDERIKRLKNLRDALAADYDLRYPPNEDIILPTRLGNMLRAAESYPQLRYRIDSVPLWPRMVYAIDEKYMAHVDTANDQCSFLLNSSLLSGIFASFSFMAVIYQLFLLYLLIYGISDLSNFSVIAEPMSFVMNGLLYLALGLLSLISAWFFYTASLFNVSKYGNMIRSSYDLFRFDLIEKLHLKLPPTFVKEKELWEQISEFITIGELYGTQYFDYPSHGPDEEAELELMLLADDNS